MTTQTIAPINYADGFGLSVLAVAAHLANVALATGKTDWQAERDEAAKALRVARQAGTAIMLAHAKSFGDLTAYIQHTDAMLASVARMKDANGRPLKVDATYRTAVMQVRGAAKALGWNAVQEATSIGSLERKRQDAVKASKGTAETDGTKAPTGLESSLTELAKRLRELDPVIAEGIVAGWLAQLAKHDATTSDTMPEQAPEGAQRQAVVNG